MDLSEKLRHLPEKPGVYLMKDKNGKIIYVGKAISLKRRVRSYFQSSHQQQIKTKKLVSHIADLEYIITDNELEALILECNLIKEHRPKYNINLKDDKSYPYLKITNEKYPRLIITRERRKDGGKYFGPYTNISAVHETKKLLQELFPLRMCSRKNLQAARPCLNFHLQKCFAPCAGKIEEQNYQQLVQEVVLFLEGHQEKIKKQLNQKMLEAAENLEFERAAVLRNQIRAIETIIEKQKIISNSGGDHDMVALAAEENLACVQIFFIRQGKLLGREHFYLEGIAEEGSERILRAFLQQYYAKAAFIPQEVYIPFALEEQGLLSLWLSRLKGKKAELKVPQRGAKKQLLQLAEKNAFMLLTEEKLRQEQEKKRTVGAVLELQQYLKLAKPPWRIEGFDISNIQGTLAVGSAVAFWQGKPKKEDYRFYKIKTVFGPNDYAMMAETIGRHYRRILSEERPLPDLILIDGGKGQLAAARNVLRELGLAHLPTLGLAKEFEYVFMEDLSEPIIIPHDKPALQLLQRVRDEAHRFGITQHRRLRSTQMTFSVLDEIKGIGAVRKKALLKHFGTVEKIKQASVEELMQVRFMNRELAESIFLYFAKQ